MADDTGPWSLWDFARRHAGPAVARKVAGLGRYLLVDAERYGARARRLRRAAVIRREVVIPALVKRVLMNGGHTVTGVVEGERRTATRDDLAVLDIDLADNALVGARLRFDAVAISRVAPVERAPRGAGGRPAEYDWEAFAIWLGATVYKDGFPKTKAQFLRKAQQWFADTQGHEPSESVLKERLNRFYAACEFGRKP